MPQISPSLSDTIRHKHLIGIRSLIPTGKIYDVIPREDERRNLDTLLINKNIFTKSTDDVSVLLDVNVQA